MSIPTDGNNQIPDRDALPRAGEIIERFGGIRPMAGKMGVPVTTVQGWKKRGVIPGNRRADVMDAALRNNVDLSDLITAQVTAFVAPIANQNVHTLGKKAPPPHVDIEESLASKIKAAEERAVKKSTWIAVGLVAGAVFGLAIMFGPGAQKMGVGPHGAVQELQADVDRLNGDVAEMKSGQSFLQKIIPPDFAEQFGAMKTQAAALGGAVTDIGAKVSKLSDDLVAADAGSVSDRLAKLENNIAAFGAPEDITALVGHVREMQQTLEGQKMLSDSVAELRTMIQSLQGAAPAAVGEPSIDAELQELQGQETPLGQALEGVPPADLKAAALLMGLAQFRGSMNRGVPFEQDLALLQSMLGDEDPELTAAMTRLAPQAERGVLTTAGLSAELRGLAGDIVVSSLKGEDVSLQEKAKARLNDVLQVEKDGDLITGTDTQTRVARAQQMLDQGDVQGALAELQALEGPAQQTAQPLIKEAEMTLLAQKIQDMLTGRVAARLGGPQVYGASPGAGLGGVLNDLEDLVPMPSRGTGISIAPPTRP